MTIHNHHISPNDREEFLVDGCPRCEQYVENLGIDFDALRFADFWRKMIQIEWFDYGRYASKLDRDLGSKLYWVSLSLNRAFGINPTIIELYAQKEVESDKV